MERPLRTQAHSLAQALGDARGRTPTERLVAGARYAWPVALERAVPVRARARRRAVARAAGAVTPAGSVPLGVVGVYRRRNAGRLLALLRQAGPDVAAALWALDEVDARLAHLTVGCGRGPKFLLLNRAIDALDLGPDGYLAVVDDDVVFARGDLTALVAVGHRLGLEIFQPSHGWASIFTYPLLVGRPRTVARQTTFVEIGPLFVMSPAARQRFLPFREEYAMGWGMDVQWAAAARGGTVLGIVDECRMVHLDPVGKGYDRTEEIRRHEAMLRDLGCRSVYDLMVTTRRWAR